MCPPGCKEPCPVTWGLESVIFNYQYLDKHHTWLEDNLMALNELLKALQKQVHHEVDVS